MIGEQVVIVGEKKIDVGFEIWNWRCMINKYRILPKPKSIISNPLKVPQ
jgi:hypothetical protein